MTSIVARMLFRALYWFAVVTVSMALVVALVLFLESRDQSSVDGARAPVATELVS